MSKPRIAYLVSSHVIYAPISLPMLLASMACFNIPREDVFVVVCESGREMVQRGPQCTFWHVTYNVPVNSCYIEAVNPAREEALKDYDYVFLLMCTTEIGPNFYQLTQDITDEWDVWGAAPFPYNGENCAQCEYGAYRLSYLRSQYAHIQKFHGCGDAYAVLNEGRMMQRAPTSRYYPCDVTPAMVRLSEPRDFYGVGADRITEYYPAIDLFKHKSNWGQGGLTLRKTI